MSPTGFDHSGGGICSNILCLFCPKNIGEGMKNIDFQFVYFSDDLKQKAPLRKGNHAQKKLP